MTDPASRETTRPDPWFYLGLAFFIALNLAGSISRLIHDANPSLLACILDVGAVATCAVATATASARAVVTFDKLETWKKAQKEASA